MFLGEYHKIPLGPASGSGLDSGWPYRDDGTNVPTYQVRAHSEALDEGVLVAPSVPRYTRVGFNIFSVQVWERWT